MYLVDRKFVCDRLILSRVQSYAIVRPTRLGLVSTDSIVEMLNKAANATQRAVDSIPTDITDANGICCMLGGAEMRDIKRWLKRKKNPIPAFRINKQTTRFSKRSVGEWVKENT